MNIKSFKYGSTLMLARLQNITNSLITLEKTHGAVKSPNGRQLYTEYRPFQLNPTKVLDLG
jgi:hypothetical protein